MAEPVKMPPMLELAVYQAAIAALLKGDSQADHVAAEKLRPIWAAAAKVHRSLTAGQDVGRATIGLDADGNLMVTHRG